MLKQLCLLNGTSGRENAVRDYIISNIPADCKYETDALGNVICHKKGRKPAKNKVMLSAHMDEVGFIITYICDDGMLKFHNVGGIDERVIFGRSVTLESGARGVIAGKAVHQCEGSEAETLPKIQDMYIDIGAGSRKEAEKYVNLGDAAYFDSEYVEFGEGFIKAKAIDDRAGCMILLKMLNSELEYDAEICFVVQEEIGTRGSGVAAFNVAPDYAIVLESTTASDISGVSGNKKVCCLGAGAVVSYMDRGTVYDVQLYRRAFELAQQNGIKIQTKTVVAGGNDAAAIHKSGAGVRTVAVSVPTRYIHSASSVAKAEDIDSVERLAFLLQEDLANA